VDGEAFFRQPGSMAGREAMVAMTTRKRAVPTALARIEGRSDPLVTFIPLLLTR
jgi:hypothetical protein